MPRERDWRQLLFADLALDLGAARADEVARALQHHWESDAISVADELVRTGALASEVRAGIEEKIERLLESVGGDARAALALRGGIDASIHASLAPETSHAMLTEGAGARAPLRVLPEGRYREFESIGKGGMGVVYLALDTELNRRVAFKMVRPDPTAPRETPPPDTPLGATPPGEESGDSARSFEELRVRFLQEAWITGAMEHPGVVPVYELGQTPAGIPYYTMRYVKGERTLATALAEAGDLDARLALLEPFLKVCDTIRYAHSRDVVHRDLKPENIALGEFGEVMVLDWGLSKMSGRPDVAGSMWQARIAEYREATDLQSMAGAFGTPGYMAPEAALGKSEELGPRSDVYSLGAILYQILTGRLPYDFKTFLEYVERVLGDEPAAPHEATPGVAEELSLACVRALRKDPAQRHASVADLASEVRRWQLVGPLQREIAALIQQAESGLEVSRTMTGNLALYHLDRAGSACAKVLSLDKENARALKLGSEIRRRRASGIRERVAVGRRRALGRVAVVALALVVVATLFVAKMLADQREKAEEHVRQAEGRARTSAGRATAARRAARESRARAADAYASLAGELLATGRVPGACLLATKALELASTPDSWIALARAEAVWAPSLVRAIRDPDATVLAIDDQGARLATAGRDGAIRIWSLSSGKRERAWQAHDGAARKLLFAPGGEVLLSTDASGQVRVWDARTGRRIRSIPSKLLDPKQAGGLVGLDSVIRGNAVTALAVTPDGGRLYAGYEDGPVRIWNVQTGEPDGGGLFRVGGTPVTAIHVNANRIAALGTAGGEVIHWNGDQTTNSIDGAQARIVQVELVEDGKEILACDATGHLFLVASNDFGRSMTVFRPSGAQVLAATVPPGRHHLVTSNADGALEFWNVGTGALAARLTEFPSVVRRLVALRTKPWVAALHDKGTVRIWDLSGGGTARARFTATAMTASRDRARVWVARPDDAIDAWDTNAGRVVGRMRGHGATVTALALAPDGELLFSASLDGTLRSWRARDGEPRKTVRIDADDPVTALIAVPDARGTRVVAGTLSGGLRFWSPAADRAGPALGRNGHPVTAFAFAAAAGRLLAGHSDGEIRTWDLDTGQSTRTDPGPGAGICALAASPDGSRFGAVTLDDRLILWDDGRPRTERLTASIGVVELAFSGDARTVSWWYGNELGGTWDGRPGTIDDGRRVLARPPPLRGAGLAWIMRSRVERLMEFENRSGLKLEGATVRPVPLREFRPEEPRVAPWSK